MKGSRAQLVRSLRVLGLLLMVGAGVLATAASAMAGELQPVASGTTKHVTILVLDMSGSMASNDPDGLRCSAANAYIDLSGPGDFVGVVGLDDPNGATGGPHNFPVATDWGLAPTEMATVAKRQALRTAIAQKSHNCAPNGSTPTYDALAKAERMLQSATQGGKIGGSVILLTDGDPDPNTSDQIKAITSELVPQFKQNNWPVDTIALGADSSFHGFLSDIASATSGSFYDDGHGVVPGVSPLNITPFFINIFRIRNGRSPGPDIPPTQLDGGTTARNFSVGQYVSHLDVVVVKDTPDAQVSVVAPDGERFPPAAAGTFVSTDPHYAIFAIDNPQQGAWELDVSGSGQFLMDSLKVSTLGLAITSPQANVPLALGEQFTITCQLTNQGTPISGGQFSLQGTITYVGGDGAKHSQDIQLRDPNGSGNYTATVTVPNNAPTGSYQIAISAQAASDSVLTSQVVVRMALFPSALLIAPATGKPTSDKVATSVVGWDGILRAIYRLPIVGWFGNLPLDGHSADPAASVRGQVVLLGKDYANATVTGVATTVGSKATIPVQVVNDGNGAFHLIFPTNASGTYNVTLTTSGAYNIAHGDLTHATRTVLVTITPATSAQEIRAWILTGVYLLLLLLFGLVIRAMTAPPLRGMLVSSTGGGGEEFARARRSPAFWLLHPAVVLSEQMGLDPGLRFAFHHGGRITVRGYGRERNYLLNGEPVPSHPVPASEAQLTATDGSAAYTIATSGRAGDEDGEGMAPAGWHQEIAQRVRGRRVVSDDDDLATDDDDDERGGRRRGLFGRRGGRDEMRDDDDDWGGRASRGSSRGRSSFDDDDDWGAPRSRGGRGGRTRDVSRDDDGDRPSQRASRQSRRARNDDDDW